LESSWTAVTHREHLRRHIVHCADKSLRDDKPCPQFPRLFFPVLASDGVYEEIARNKAFSPAPALGWWQPSQSRTEHNRFETAGYYSLRGTYSNMAHSANSRFVSEFQTP
jgi:hypothetical protein